MRRPMLFVTILLCIATAVVFTSAAWLVSPPARAQPAGAGEETARRFYAAVNAAIATGDLEPLRAVVAEDVAAGEALPGVPAGRAGLEVMLADLHETAPGTRLEVAGLVAAGDRVMARIEIAGAAGSYLGIPVLAAPRPWGSVDLLRVRGGKVVEREGVAEGTGLLRHVHSTPLGLAGPSRRVLTLQRVALRPGTSFEGSAPFAPHLLLVETGAVRLELSTASTYSVLAAGESVVVPIGGRVTATNTGDGVASFLHLALAVPQAGGSAMGSQAALASLATPATSVAGDAATRVLAGGGSALILGGPLEVGVGRMLLAPGADVSLAGMDGVALLAVDAGWLSVEADGKVYVRRGIDGVQQLVATAHVDAGGGLLIEENTSLQLRNDGSAPVDAVLVTITVPSA